MTQGLVGAEAIESLIPHRGAALFVREATLEGEFVHGEVAWDAQHPVLQGHFPGQPIVPGVFLVEAAAQLAGVWIASTYPQTPGLGMLAGIRKVLVHSPLLAEQPVRFSLKVNGSAGGLFSVSGVGSGDQGQKVVTLDLLIVVKQASQ